MAEPLKNMYHVAFFEELCPVLRSAIPGFDCKRFIHLVFDNTWPELELKQRVSHIARCLHQFLPEEFPHASKILTDLSDKLRANGSREQSFAPIFIPEYISLFGQDHPAESLKAIEEITKLVSAEFAIRPFLIRYPEQTLKQMIKWSRNSHESVRRLSSEGCRPRLPWGISVPWIKKNPEAILPILENLKSDKSLYVRKSVANSLNDISKDNPQMVLKIARDWRNISVETDWIIRHACRGLLKKGDTNALALHGFDHQAKAVVQHLQTDKKKVRIGEALEFSFHFESKSKNSTQFRIEYSIDYLTSTGKVSSKVFQIKESEFDRGQACTITRRQSFKDLTTRKHYKGPHQLHILVNGKKSASTEFTLC